MNLSSKDIKKNDFKKTFRGYDVNEVDAFLDTVSSHYEKQLIENKNLLEKIKSLSADIEIYKENEINLQKAIIKSQEIAEENIKNAKKRAEMIVKEAELNSRKMRQDIDEDIIRKKQELEDIKLRNDKLIEDVKNFLNDKLIEFENFLKNKKIFNMELTSYQDENQEENKEEESENKELKQPIKKIYINPQDAPPKGESFDDTFDVKK